MNISRHSAHETIRATVNVGLGKRAYDITISDGLLQHAGATISPLLKRPVTAIVTDENVATHHLETLAGSLKSGGHQPQCVDPTAWRGHQVL